jgi:hypothetical protein
MRVNPIGEYPNNCHKSDCYGIGEDGNGSQVCAARGPRWFTSPAVDTPGANYSQNRLRTCNCFSTYHEVSALDTLILSWNRLTRTIRMEIAAGVTPGILEACPSESGRMAASFSRISLESPGTSA